MLGWEIMRENSVSAENWQEVVDVYVRDRKNLRIREWFDQNNPQAFQGMTQVLLETVRKGYWSPDAATVREIAEAHARSVVRYGKNSGIRGGGNVAFQKFIQGVLDVPGDARAQALLADYRATRTAAASAAEPAPAAPAPETRTVTGQKLEPVPAAPRWRRAGFWLAAGGAFLGLLAYGFVRRKGTIQ